jgi:D-alanyl-D-alanine carboxypeptidase/D-alanyl-D-alanine-endopeptidase (penicillin-binding protein 4)
VQATNSESQNLYAESLCKLIGSKEGNTGSTRGGIKQIREYWKDKIPGLPQCNLEDGSGLSARNLLNASVLVDLLKYIYQDTVVFNGFDKMLSQAGISGTLEKNFERSTLKGKFSGKSGTMQRVKNYAGYMTSDSGEKYACAFLINNFTCSQKQLQELITPVLESVIAGPVTQAEKE